MAWICVVWSNGILLLLDPPPCPYSIIIIGWWYSSPEQRLQGHKTLPLYYVKFLLCTPRPHSRPIISSCANPSSSLWSLCASLLFPLQVQSFLLPPPLRHPCPWPPSRLLTEVQKPVMSQYTAQIHYASSWRRSWYPWIPLPPLPSPM